jgi:ribosomal protein S3
LKKCGDIAVTGVDEAHQMARLKTGVVGVQVKIMPSTTVLPDKVEIKEYTQVETVVAETKESKDETQETTETKKEVAEVKKKAPRKTPAKKKAVSKSSESEDVEEQMV